MANKRAKYNKSIDNLVTVSEFHNNASQKLIVTTKDKVHLCLMKYIEDMGQRKAWLVPFGMLVTVGITLLTADFKYVLLKPDAWRGAFWMLAAVLSVWTVYAYAKRRNAKSIENVVDEITLGDIYEPDLLEYLKLHKDSQQSGKLPEGYSGPPWIKKK